MSIFNDTVEVLRDIIVIGGSAGSLGALEKIVQSLSADLGATIFVVVHVPQDRDSVLPEILSRAGALPATHASDSELFQQNRIYVAPPADRHLQLEKDRVRLVFGPRENHARPAIDVLFRTAALTFGPRVIGIILSGTLDDGSNGLTQVKRLGGIAIVQDPNDAECADMPRNALRATNVDFRVPASEIAGLLKTLVAQPIAGEDKEVAEQESDKEFLGITCPECHGPIYVAKADNSLHFSCIVGHAYSPEAMRSDHGHQVEAAMWSAVASLREHANLLKKMAQNLPSRAELLTKDATLKEQHARELEALVEKFNR